MHLSLFFYGLQDITMKVKLSSQAYRSLLEGYPQLKRIIEEYAETEIIVIRSSYDGLEVGLNFHIKTEKLLDFYPLYIMSTILT